MAASSKIGPAGSFDFGGPQFPGDKGGINIGFRLLSGGRQAALEFGTVLTTLAGTPEQTRTIARMMVRRITEHYGPLHYDVSTLPIRVGVSQDRKFVIVVLPTSTTILVANPEVFLALAQRMEEEAAKIG